MRADVYYDQQEEQLSVKDREAGSETYGRVVAKTSQLRIEDATVVTYEGKRQEAVEQDCDNVHAVIRGEVDVQVLVVHTGTHVEYERDEPGCFLVDGERLADADSVSITTIDNVLISAHGVTTAEDSDT